MEHGEGRRNMLMDVENSQTSASLTLRTAQDAVALLERSRALFRPLNVSEVRLAMEGFPLHPRAVLETRLNVYLKECGCAASNVAAAISILVYALLIKRQLTRNHSCFRSKVRPGPCSGERSDVVFFATDQHRDALVGFLKFRENW